MTTITMPKVILQGHITTPAKGDIPATRTYRCGCWYSWDCGWSHCTDHWAPKGVLLIRKEN